MPLPSLPFDSEPVSLPLALYVHLPWCVKKCPYCDFNSHATDLVPETTYLEALERDLVAALPLVWGRGVGSIFIGGGTPSLFSAESIDRVLSLIRTLLRISPTVEITLEANPGTFEIAKFEGFHAAGVNRLSLGVQSFDDAALRRIGRIHDGQQAYIAAEAARSIFRNINLDLIYALPGQNATSLQHDLDTALALAPDHLSVYHLTLEPNTAFGHTPPFGLPDDDTAADMQEQVERALATFEHYETSAFARAGKQCRHNRNYWEFGDYLGIGAGAHSKLTFPDRILRQARLKHPEAYIKATHSNEHIESERMLTEKDLAFEFMMNALRLTGGVNLALFEERTGIHSDALAQPLETARRRGLLDLAGENRIVPTQRGQRFLNELLQLFLD